MEDLKINKSNPENNCESYCEAAKTTVWYSEMQFGFMPGHVTTNAIFILRRLQE